VNPGRNTLSFTRWPLALLLHRKGPALKVHHYLGRLPETCRQWPAAEPTVLQAAGAPLPLTIPYERAASDPALNSGRLLLVLALRWEPTGGTEARTPSKDDDSGRARRSLARWQPQPFPGMSWSAPDVLRAVPGRPRPAGSHLRLPTSCWSIQFDLGAPQPEGLLSFGPALAVDF
jgi:hypothetical protein